MKACVDCRFLSAPAFYGQCCLNDRCGDPDIVHGLTYSGARQAREDETKCGADARYFERRRVSEGATMALFLFGVPAAMACGMFVLFRVF